MLNSIDSEPFISSLKIHFILIYVLVYVLEIKKTAVFS